MNERAERAIEYVIKVEGGDKFVKIKNDPGGATKYGISLRFLKQLKRDIDGDGDIDEDDIKALTYDDAEDIYLDEFWNVFKFEEIQSDLIAFKVFEIAVHTGPNPAFRVLQRAANDLNASLSVDGILGDMTLSAVNELDPKLLLEWICQEVEAYYKRLLKGNPYFSNVINGWIRRAHLIPPV
jgi:lysozyme family protein